MEKSENDPVPERRREREERIQGSQAAAREKRKVSAIQKDRERLEKLRYKLNCVHFVRVEHNFFQGSWSNLSFLERRIWISRSNSSEYHLSIMLTGEGLGPGSVYEQIVFVGSDLDLVVLDVRIRFVPEWSDLIYKSIKFI